jgi:hypothetical protein
MNPRDEKELHERITKGIRKGVARALNEHKKAGRSIAVWKNGKVEKIPAEKINVTE